MKKLILVLTVILLAFPLASQPCLDLGVKGGLTSSELRPDRNWEHAANNLSVHAGAFSRIGWGRLFVQPEAYFNSRGGSVEEIFDDNPLKTAANFDFSSLDIPVLAGLKLVKGDFFNFRVLGGPVFGIVTAGDVESHPRINSGYFRDHFYGWQFGAGVDIWFLTLDARVENSRNSIYKSSDITTRNKVLMVSVGIKIF
ncbi:MAG TPA: porin family protein [Prolixibacteraceae bacterium]|nr:porin family protein [Prolixibacteraceae bacterium]HOS00627.1 porin family protein [Prolixibacteraceae bacterium]HPL45345.1 porin family protein [Prolixibacteraceae bacterium]